MRLAGGPAITDPNDLKNFATEEADPDPVKRGYLSRTADIKGSYLDSIDEHVVTRIETESAVEPPGKKASCEASEEEPKLKTREPCMVAGDRVTSCVTYPHVDNVRAPKEADVSCGGDPEIPKKHTSESGVLLHKHN